MGALRLPAPTCSTPLSGATRRRTLLAALCLAASAEAQYSAKETASALRWWCEPGRGREAGPLCLRWSLTDAIASAVEESDKVARVDKLKAAIQAGQIDGQAVDATNPQRHDMMDGWCADDSAVEEDPSTKRQVCARVRNRKDFVARRGVLLQWWCGEMKHFSSVKCKQMQFGTQVESTLSGAERKVRRPALYPFGPMPWFCRGQRQFKHVPAMRCGQRASAFRA